MKKFLTVLIFTILPFVLIEFKIKDKLFKKVKYTNVNDFDAKIESFQKEEWNTLFIGSSEVHWGFSPKVFDSTQSDKEIKTFNFALNGMTIDRYFRIIPYLKKSIFDKKPIKTVFIGLNLTEPRRLNSGKLNCDELGSFEKPIYLSSFGKDSNLFYELCELSTIKYILKPLEKISNIFRYRQSVREYIFRKRRNVDLEKLNLTKAGFHYRKSLQEDARELKLTDEWFADPKNISDMSEYNVDIILKADGLLSQFVKYLQSYGLKVVLFDNPTNPRLVKYYKGHHNFKNNYVRIQKWAKENKTVFLHVKEVNQFDPLKDFADRRHLSERGAKKFSLLLSKMYKDYLINSK